LSTSIKTPPVAARGLKLRWYICGLLFFATTINYIDRQILGLLKPIISRELHWTEADFGWIISAFQAAYAIMMPLAGRLVDWIGPKRGYAIAVVFWSLAAMSHSLARNVLQFATARFALGLGESANFPAALRTVADWFPQQERALATGIFNSGTNIGALVAPLIVPWITVRFGWRPAFLVTSGLVVIWLVLWFTGYRHRPASVVQADSKPVARLPYLSLVTERRTWAFLSGKVLTDPVWWFYLFWLPGFLDKNYGLNLTAMGAPLVAVYLLADVGSVAGGWLSSSLLKRGFTANRARKTAMLVCAVAVTGVMFVPFTQGNLWLAVALIGLAAGAHQGWSANLFTLPSDLFPQEAVGSVVGLGGLGGAISGALVAPMVGYWLDFSHGAYGPLFVIAGLMYLIALGVIHMLVPKLDRLAQGNQ
jgi:ACS family hexuronate transporter-like MFS transporter